MQSFVVGALALAAISNALPSEHRRGHTHHRRKADYDVSNVDWDAIDWASVFGQKAATAAAAVPAATVVTPATTAAVAKTEAVATPVATSASTASSAVAAASTTAAQSTSVAKTSNSGKKGLAWDQGNDPSLATLFETSSMSWTYNWGMGASFSSSMNYFWHIRTAAELSSLGSITPGATVLGFNEPDQDGMSASEAVSYYQNQITPLRKSGAIGSLGTPGITNGASGLPWLESFMAQCSDCEIDFLQVHFYGPDLSMFQSQMEAIHAALPSYPISITEIGCTNWNAATNPSAGEISTFMTEAIAWMESTSWITSYAFFGAMPITDTSLGVANEMLNGRTAGSSLTSLGQQYIAA